MQQKKPTARSIAYYLIVIIVNMTTIATLFSL